MTRTMTIWSAVAAVYALGGLGLWAIMRMSAEAEQRAQDARDRADIAERQRRAAEGQARLTARAEAIAAHPCSRSAAVIPFPVVRPYDWQNDNV